MNTANAKTSTALDFTRDLNQNGKIIAEYVWVDGSQQMRAKCRTLNKKVTDVDQIPDWNFDGSSCYMATTENSEVILKAVAYYPDPFRRGDNILVLCECYSWEDTTYQKLVPANSNFRSHAKFVFDADEVAAEKPWYGIEQEYTILEDKNRFAVKPYGWPSAGYPGNQGPYYCSVGGNVTFGRTIADAHYKCCLYSGITISGTNAEVMPGQWEY